MTTPLVSIIVPIYNVEKYLRRCLDSVSEQTYQNWECICVNDGSPDGSAAILEEYRRKDSRFKIVNRENGGLSMARNSGLDVMAGDYLIFIDSDDFIHPQLLEICVWQALRDNSDLVVFRFSHMYRNITKILHSLNLPEYRPCFRKYRKEKVETVTTDNIYDYVTENSHEKLPGVEDRFRVKHCQVWRHLYRAEAVKGLRFCPGIMFEDLPWWGEVLLHVKRATINNLPLYYYYPNKTSFLASNEHKMIKHLKLSIPAAESVYENAGTPEQKRIWQERFIKPFKYILAKKINKYGDA